MTICVNAAAGWRLSLLSNLSAAAEAQACAIRASDDDISTDIWRANLKHALVTRLRFCDYLVKYISVNGHRHPEMSFYLLRLDAAVDAQSNTLTEPVDIIERRLRFFDALNSRNPHGDTLYCDEFADRFEFLKEEVRALEQRNSPIFDLIKYIDETNIGDTYFSVVAMPNRTAEDLYGPRYIKADRCPLTATAHILNQIETELACEADPLSWIDEMRRSIHHERSIANGDAPGFILHVRSANTATMMQAMCRSREGSQTATLAVAKVYSTRGRPRSSGLRSGNGFAGTNANTRGPHLH
jgi:hypothetical protein